MKYYVITFLVESQDYESYVTVAKVKQNLESAKQSLKEIIELEIENLEKNESYYDIENYDNKAVITVDGDREVYTIEIQIVDA